jgi:hypothetical protein
MDLLTQIVMKNPAEMDRVNRCLAHWHGYMNAGGDARERGDHRAAGVCYGAALAECDGLPGLGLVGDHYALALEGYAITLIREGNVSEGQAALEIARQYRMPEMERPAACAKPEREWRALMAAGNAALQAGDANRAETLHLQALARAESLVSEFDGMLRAEIPVVPLYLISAYNLARLHKANRQHDEVENHLRRPYLRLQEWMANRTLGLRARVAAFKEFPRATRILIYHYQARGRLNAVRRVLVESTALIDRTAPALRIDPHEGGAEQDPARSADRTGRGDGQVVQSAE